MSLPLAGFCLTLLLGIVGYQVISRRSNARRTGQVGPLGRIGPGGGQWNHLADPTFLRGTSDMLAYLFPWILGSGVPPHGVPVGKVTRKVAGRRKARAGATVACDPWSWYRAKLLNAPNAFILGLPGLGKSTLIRRWIWGLDFFGVKSLVLGDLKGEHVDLIRALGGQVIRVGRGAGHINVLDLGSAPAAVQRMLAAGLDEAAAELLAVSRGRRQSAVETLLTLEMRRPLTNKETAVVATALAQLDRTITDRTPIIEDLWDAVEGTSTGPSLAMDSAAGAHGNTVRYREIVDDLLTALRNLAHGQGLGEVFSQESTVRLDVTRHTVFDVSGLNDTDERLRAAALTLCWSLGFGEVEIANALAAAGLAKQRQWHIVLDELWRALRAAEGMADLVDSLTRLSRDKGVAITFASHTMDDLEALPTEGDRKKAAGILERCGLTIAFGCAASEMPRLQRAVKLTRIEMKTLTSWTTPPSVTAASTANEAWPGRGKFLIKMGERPGIACDMEDLIPEEKPYSETARKWQLDQQAEQVAA